jgi:glucosyl-3-phosphoglycerate synthase
VRRFHHREFLLGRLRELKRDTVSVVLPTREVAETVGEIVEAVLSLGDLVDQLVVVDAASDDGTADIAAAAGAEVRQESDLLPELGPVLGKGDAMWRALAAVRGDLVVYVDSDTLRFPSHFVPALIGPLVAAKGIEFVKGAFRRPFLAGGVELPEGGGRVTELCARPLLRAFYPELAELSQPLAGEVAARRALLERIPFTTGYGVELAMLLDVHAEADLGAIAQVDIGERRNRHQPLRELGPMADAVLGVVLDRLPVETAAPRPVERPPFASVRAAA